MARVVVGSSMIRVPLGGRNQAVLAWLVGLQQLGHDVYFVERTPWSDSNFDVPKRVMNDDCSYGIAVVTPLLQRHGLGERWCYVDANNRYYGLNQNRVQEIFRTADCFLDLEWNEWPAEAAEAKLRVLIDGEPGWRHMKMENSIREGAPLPIYDYYYTAGHNIGTPRSPAPTAGKTWGKYFWPIMVDAIPFDPPTGPGAFTTVMRWRTHKPVTFNGATYGQKDVEFPKFMALPRLTHVPMEVAASGRIPRETQELLLDSGWRIRDADEVSTSIDSYWRYILSSRGEFGVNKNVFVATNNGAFTDRAGCYMASGRPAVVQETGFSEHLPCGRGLFAVRTVEEAAAAIEAIESDYMTHAHAAREIAREYLDARKVLAKLLGEIGVA
jgi:hypothetical protein